MQKPGTQWGTQPRCCRPALTAGSVFCPRRGCGAGGLGSGDSGPLPKLFSLYLSGRSASGWRGRAAAKRPWLPVVVTVFGGDCDVGCWCDSTAFLCSGRGSTAFNAAAIAATYGIDQCLTFHPRRSFLRCHRHPPRRLHGVPTLSLMGIAGGSSLACLLVKLSGGRRARIQAVGVGRQAGVRRSTGRSLLHKPFLETVRACGWSAACYRHAGGRLQPRRIEKMAPFTTSSSTAS